MLSSTPRKFAVVGAGIAGTACSHALILAGHSVHLFDKSRGPGGRLATRRLEWVDRNGQACTTRLDHGAVGITARSAAFQSFIDQAVHAGWLVEWVPVQAAGSLPLEDGDRICVPEPDMPALCRRLLDGVTTTWSFAVDSLYKSPAGWQVEAAGERHSAQFDAVVLALPPAQASPLLSAHRKDWAGHASVIPMQPCWTLMGIAAAPEPAVRWDLARPPAGPLAWVLRNDARPGRERVPGRAHWVTHARAAWSRQHLEQPAAWVQQQLQDALAEYLGQPVDWHHSVVHRWRYALPPAQGLAPSEPCWWDADQGLGVCGDFLGGTGVEGAWLSAQSLSAAIFRSASDAAAYASARAQDESVRQQACSGTGLEQPAGDNGVNTLAVHAGSR
ncbi:MAG: NAD(P)-binding protein [Pseudoxanthomonas sp.]|nr:NAD(P)-binding protein [Pseudoxanthomonas sp.]